MNYFNILEFQKKINRPLILDGALGSLIQQSTRKVDKYLWSSIYNITNPQLVKSIHKEYLDAGAEIITTNTFRTNPVACELSNYDINIKDFVKVSVDLVKAIIDKEGIFIAGSNAPAEDCYQINRTISLTKLEYNHKKHIELLYENGVDFILNETQSHYDEINIICKFCNQNKIPFIISLYSNDGKTILSGESLEKIIPEIISYEPVAISFNCISVNIFNKIDNTIYNYYKNGFYLNMGDENREGQFNNLLTPSEYKLYAKQFLNNNTLFVGACCGSTPLHIINIRDLINEIY